MMIREETTRRNGRGLKKKIITHDDGREMCQGDWAIALKVNSSTMSKALSEKFTIEQIERGEHLKGYGKGYTYDPHPGHFAKSWRQNSNKKLRIVSRQFGCPV